MNKKYLPVGIQDFKTIRDGGFYYVDKTAQILHLVEHGRNYFLSRPRRFGKSLLLDTFQELFECNEPLFRGLHVHNHWDWANKRLVVRLSFDGRHRGPEDIERTVLKQLKIIEHNAGLKAIPGETAQEFLLHLLDRLHRASGKKVVVLVDEYDKPILDVIDNKEMATANRDLLGGIYGIIKGSARNVHFVFVTGVSMFSKVSMFSYLNNLDNISLEPDYATICGYTDNDLDTVFAPELEGLDRNEIRRWYNGYHWRGEEKLYNPFDVLLLFKKRDFDAYWFETGSPRFLFETLKARSVNPIEFENQLIDKTVLSNIEVENIPAEALLFQAGYMTIVDEFRDGGMVFYRLDYPNYEVEFSLNNQLLANLDNRGKVPLAEGKSFKSCLETHDFEAFADQLRTWLASIPYQWHIKNDLARYEAWYLSLLLMCLRTASVEVRAEESISHGRYDMVIDFGEEIFILEFKVVKSQDEVEAKLVAAFDQMRKKGYANKYRDKSIHLIAVVCGSEARNLLEIKAEAFDAPQHNSP
ncbi:MAG: AAA family ATPase [Gammaproteobacteria bacterium]|nr:AAA family ATPase [Gammaproteobacteria bacterium]